MQLHDIYASAQPPDGFWDVVNRVNWVKVALFFCLGAACGALADELEPAKSPNHRRFFHSFCFGGLVVYGAFGKHSQKWSQDVRDAVGAGAFSYISHLVVDSGTPKGLPAIC